MEFPCENVHQPNSTQDPSVKQTRPNRVDDPTLYARGTVKEGTPSGELART